MLRSKTLEVLSQLNIKDRKKLGQYFTPSVLRKVLLDALPEDGIQTIMEPSFGTGEFLYDLTDKYPSAKIDGYEIDVKLYESVNPWSPGVLTHGDFLFNDIPAETYDLVVGNPPYFQTTVNPKYKDVISGRPNVFSYFFQESARVLKPGGWLAFVVPASMCTGSYFSALRSFLTKNFGLQLIKRFSEDEFEDAQQSVVVVVAQKGTVGKEGLIFNDIFDTYNDGLLKTAYERGKTLTQLGFHVKTGNVVWNQWKDCLSDTRVSPNDKRLFWSHNISDVGIIPTLKRPSYLTGRALEIEPFLGPALLVNRTLGTVGKGQLRCGLFPYGHFYAENHVNVVFHKDGDGDKLQWLMGELRKPRTTEIARRLTGNTQLSKTELQNLPIEEHGKT